MRAIPLLGLMMTVALANPISTSAAQDLRIYGPGGPEPAIREAARQFGAAHGIDIAITAGPTGRWIDAAKADADLIYSGSETMMTDFLNAMGGELVAATVTPLYLRASAILVRPGNPRQIESFNDLLVPGVKILIVNGAGQNGLWEDIAGRKGNIASVKALRANIVAYAKTSAEARHMAHMDNLAGRQRGSRGNCCDRARAAHLPRCGNRADTSWRGQGDRK
jgi:accessory colonization factor AcfC